MNKKANSIYVKVDTTNFDKNLSPNDDTVQKALDSINSLDFQYEVFNLVGNHNPSIEEYPNIIGAPDDAGWSIVGLGQGVGYTFQTGYLQGETLYDGDVMVLTNDSVSRSSNSPAWVRILSSLNPTLFYSLNGQYSITGNFQAGNFKIVNLADGTAETDGVTVKQLSERLNKNGDSMLGILNLGNNKIINVTNGTADSDVATIGQLNNVSGNYLPITGGTLTGKLIIDNIQNHLTLKSTGVGDAYEGYIDFIDGADAVRGKIGFLENNLDIISIESPGDIILRNGAANTLTVTSGKVGVNEGSPLALLDIRSDVVDEKMLQFRSDRPWAFINLGINQDAHIALRSDFATQSFFIQDELNNNIIEFYADGVGGISNVTLHSSLYPAEYIGSILFASGFSGQGWAIKTVGGLTDATFDSLTVRGTMNIYEFVINKIRAGNGNTWFSSGGKTIDVDLVSDPSNYILSFELASGGVPFVEGDIIKCQQFDGNNVKSYEGIVTSVFMHPTNSEWQSLKFDKATTIGGGSPEIGDTVVKVDSDIVDRRGAVYIATEDSYSPFIDVIIGDGQIGGPNNVKARLGKLDGIADIDAGLDGTQVESYGLYSANVFLTGHINAATGNIGGWIINSTSFYNDKIILDSNASIIKIEDDVNNLIQMYWNHSTDWGLLGKKANVAIFELGSINRIAKWNFDNNALWTGGDKPITIDYTEPGVMMLSTAYGILTPQFYVDITTGNAYFKGRITATTGTIGGFDIDDDAIYSGSKTIAGFTAPGEMTLSPTKGIHTATFYVNADGLAKFSGELVAATGDFEGQITAASGIIGGFTIDAQSLYSDKFILDSLTGILTLITGPGEYYQKIALDAVAQTIKFTHTEGMSPPSVVNDFELNSLGLNWGNNTEINDNGLLIYNGVRDEHARIGGTIGTDGYIHIETEDPNSISIYRSLNTTTEAKGTQIDYYSKFDGVKTQASSIFMVLRAAQEGKVSLDVMTNGTTPILKQAIQCTGNTDDETEVLINGTGTRPYTLAVEGTFNASETASAGSFKLQYPNVTAFNTKWGFASPYGIVSEAIGYDSLDDEEHIIQHYDLRTVDLVDSLITIITGLENKIQALNVRVTALENPS